MSKVLIISQHGWPPNSNAQILRLASLARHLPEHGWEPIVVSRKVKNSQGDKDLVRELSGIKNYGYRSFSVNRAFMHRFSRKAFLPDAFLPEIFASYRVFRHVISREKPDVLFVSTPPSGLYIGAILSSKTDIPLVIDYADAWTTNPVYRPPSTFHAMFERKMEGKIVHMASAITGAAPGQIQDIEKAFKIENAAWIPNGFEDEIYECVSAFRHKKVVFLYAGTVYREFDLSFLEIFEDIYSENAELRGKFSVRFVGNMAENQREYVSRYENTFVEVIGKVTRHEFVRELLGADVLIFAREELYDRDSLSSRIPEYLGSKKPVMAFLPENTLISEVLRMAGTGYIFSRNERTKAKEFIMNVITGGLEVNPDMEYIKKFSWRNISGDLANILNKVMR